MLRIKESEWQRFCENAEKLGLKKIVKYYSNDEISICKKNHFCLVNNINYSPYDDWGESRTINMYNTQRLFIGNVIYDLIEQGYVEKVDSSTQWED